MTRGRGHYRSGHGPNRLTVYETITSQSNVLAGMAMGLIGTMSCGVLRVSSVGAWVKAWSLVVLTLEGTSLAAPTLCGRTVSQNLAASALGGLSRGPGGVGTIKRSEQGSSRASMESMGKLGANLTALSNMMAGLLGR